MILCINNVLNATQLSAIETQIAADPAAFETGATTAGWHAKAVKNNEQAGGTTAVAVCDLVQATLRANAVFRAAAHPKQLNRMMLSRYRPGMEYGTHVDDPLMGSVRNDMSFTLFLRDPASYDGGALIIESSEGDNAIKLSAGSLVLYPTTSLHRVEQVTRGERLAVVGWVRSFIRHAEDREILFDIENTIAALRTANADRAVLDRLFKIRANLVRKWAED
jgi:PKHD-type hydroxylase